MTRSPSRRAFAAGGLILGFAGAARAQTANPDAMSIGAAAAPIQLVEFASATCPHCAHFHETNWAILKRDYIDTGRVRLTLQEMLTAPPALAFALFQLARCGNADGPEYFRRLAIIFDRQNAIFDAAQTGHAADAIVSLGGEWGLSQPQVMASLRDEVGQERIMRSIGVADAQGVSSTPTFRLNGQPVAEDFREPEGMVRILNAALSR